MKYTLLILLAFIISFSGCMIKDENKEEKETKTQSEKREAEKSVISEEQTTLYDKSENRLENIRLAAEALNGYVIKAGDTFSFNETVGERTKERGYKKAPVLHDRERDYDYGGGVCQLSTTLYQAAEKAGFDITERSGHKKEINYAAKGEDAAVDYGLLDLKFVNNTDSDAVICVEIYDDSIVVKLKA